MRIITLKEDEFNNYAIKHKYESFYQTSSYANFESNNGYDIHYLGFTNDNGDLIGATMLLYKTLFWGYKYAYAPRGFLIDYTDQFALNNITNALKKLLYKQNFIFIKIDPLVIASERDKDGKIIYFSDTVNEILSNLKKNDYEHQGFNLYYESTLPRWNVFSKLNSNSRELFNAFNKETKDNIKTSNRMAVKIIEDQNQDIKKFYDFIKKDYGKKGFNYYNNLYNNFKDSNKIKIFYAYIDTNQYTKNTNDLYNRELEKNTGLSNIIASQNNNKYNIPKAISDKIESDKLINTYKRDIIISTDLLRKYPNDILCGACMVIAQNKGINFFINYKLDSYERFKINDAMTYEIMKYYSKLNYRYVNLGPITGNFNKDSKFYNLLNDKIGFNSSVIEYIGEFNLIINPLMYKIYKRKENKSKKKGQK